MLPTVLIVDDHDGFRSFARTMLEAEGFRVIGDAGDGESGIAAGRRLRPAVVVLDIHLPDIDGFEVAERLNELDDPPAVVLVSTRDAESLRRRLATTTARGFIRKEDLSGAAVAALVAK
ncbi:MAG TPA: response regulator transcription factor [Thermoleophilaceae bacterium]